MRQLIKAPIIIFVLLTTLFYGCSDEDQSTRLIVTLVDSPGDYVAVNVDIQGVYVHVNADALENDPGWILLDGSEVGITNLLDFTDGVELTLYDSNFPTGLISQMRLLLGDNNTVVVDVSSETEENYDTLNLETPSAQQSGLKLLIHTNLEEGITYHFKLDFDAARSVIETGSGKYKLKPVIKVITTELSGAIEGEVLPAEESIGIYVINGDDTVGTSYAEMDVSEFLVPGIIEGTYTVSIDPGDNSEYLGQTLDDVTVNTGEVKDIGTIELSLK